VTLSCHEQHLTCKNITAAGSEYFLGELQEPLAADSSKLRNLPVKLLCMLHMSIGFSGTLTDSTNHRPQPQFLQAGDKLPTTFSDGQQTPA